MSYNYTNPFMPAPSASRSTFSAVGSAQSGRQVLFGGLPLDVTESDIRDLLINEPLGLPASTTTPRAIYTSDGAFTGFAIIHVLNETDAERIRREYSGQIIDATFRLTVQHILPPTQPIPPPTVVPMAFPVAPPIAAPVVHAPPPTAPAQPRPKPPAGNNDKAPGLRLLARMSNGGPSNGNNKQAALIAQQKANLKGAREGAGLLSRLAKPKPKPAPAAKVGRAKQAIAEKPTVKAQPKPKTQADLDEEMRAYTRKSRFA